LSLNKEQSSVHTKDITEDIMKDNKTVEPQSIINIELIKD